MANTKTRRKAYKCGRCSQLGHNARTCPNEQSLRPRTTTPAVTTPVVTETEETEETEVPQAPAPTKIERSVNVLSRDRHAVTPSVPGCFECPRCLLVAELVLVELSDGDGKQHNELRCAKCHNNTPVLRILKWGCNPEEKPAAQNR